MLRPKITFDLKTFGAYIGLILVLGACIGYYVLPYFFKPSDRFIFERGMIFGVGMYRQNIQNSGTFDILSDSTINIYLNRDTIVLKK